MQFPLKNDNALFQQMMQAAALAPSAENTQPWSFRIEGPQLMICLERQYALDSDLNSMLALTAIGACTENAVIAARAAGYQVNVRNISTTTTPVRNAETEPIVALSCVPQRVADPLCSFLEQRCTSRRLHSTHVPTDQCQQLAEAAREFRRVNIHWLTDRPRISEIAKLVGISNRIRFEHQPFHQEFYHNLRLTPQEVRDTRDGLDLANLQLPLGVSTTLTLLRQWPRMQLANLFGFSRGVQRQATTEMLSSGAVGILTVDETSRTAFVEGGRALERIWLTATSMNLGFHPVAALGVFLTYANDHRKSQLVANHQRTIEQLALRYNLHFPDLSERVLQMVFRIGHVKRIPPKTLRRPISIQSAGPKTSCE